MFRLTLVLEELRMYRSTELSVGFLSPISIAEQLPTKDQRLFLLPKTGEGSVVQGFYVLWFFLQPEYMSVTKS